MTAIPKLPLAAMHTRHDGLTEATANYYFEAARVCLDRHHESPREIEIDSNGTKSPVVADWEPPDDRTRGAWANEIDATEDGAYACALAAAEVSEGLVAVYRAETGTGADWYIAPKGKTVEDLEDCLRFEVSGVDCGNEIAVAQRLKKKLKQTAAGDSNLPAMGRDAGSGRLIDAVRGRDWCHPATVYRAHRILHSRQDRRRVTRACQGSG